MGADTAGAHMTGAGETTGMLQPPKQVPLPQLPHVLTGAGAAQLEQLEQPPEQPDSPHPPSFDLSLPSSPQPPPQLELPHPPQHELLQVAAPPTRAFSARNLLSRCPAAATSASIRRIVSHVICRLNVRKSFDEFAMSILPSQVVCPVAFFSEHHARHDVRAPQLL